MIPFRRIRVAGHSMEPALRPGDVVWTIRKPFVRQLRQGDLALVRDPRDGRLLLKRVIAGPGGEHAGRVLALDEYWLQGDNPGHSRDSHDFGPVAFPKILGRVLRRR